MRTLRTIIVGALLALFCFGLILDVFLAALWVCAYLQRSLSPTVFILSATLMLTAFALNLILAPDGWLFKRDARRWPDFRGWLELVLQLFAGGMVLVLTKMMMETAWEYPPGTFWVMIVGTGALVIGATLLGSRRNRLRR